MPITFIFEVVADIVKSRRTIREYTDEAPSREIVEKYLI
jgi:nitroreductase